MKKVRNLAPNMRYSSSHDIHRVLNSRLVKSQLLCYCSSHLSPLWQFQTTPLQNILINYILAETFTSIFLSTNSSTQTKMPPYYVIQNSAVCKNLHFCITWQGIDVHVVRKEACNFRFVRKGLARLLRYNLISGNTILPIPGERSAIYRRDNNGCLEGVAALVGDTGDKLSHPPEAASWYRLLASRGGTGRAVPP